MSNIYEARFSEAPKASSLDQFCQKLLLKQLSKLQKGCLKLTHENETTAFGDQDASLQAEIYVQHSSAYRQVLFGGSIGAGEAYMAGSWTTPNLTNVVRVFVQNIDVLDDMDTSFTFIKRLLSKFNHLLNANTLTGSKKNISAHYDLNNDFFQLFLDESMMYSSGIYLNTEDTLEQASINKLRRVCDTLKLDESDHLLEIGTGWGGLAIFAAKHYGCQVTTTTISKEQYLFAKARIREEGLEDKITLLLKDYRKVSGSFDKIVSIEMIEAVGHKFLSNYFKKCSSLLKEDGLMLLQAITIPDQRYDYYCKEPDFIKTYIFPGGHLPSLNVISRNIARHTDFQLIDFKDIGFDYAKTLNDWHKRFSDNRDKLTLLGFDETFIRMWEYYFSYCEGGFIEQSISTSQILFSKPRGKDRAFRA